MFRPPFGMKPIELSFVFPFEAVLSMSTINEVFEIHVHGQVQLRQDLAYSEIEEALKPLWIKTGEKSLQSGAASIYDDEVGIVYDDNEHLLQICWTVISDLNFHQNLDEFCMGLNELTAKGSVFEVTFFNEQFEGGDQAGFEPDEDDEGEFFEETLLLFVGPTPAAIMDIQRDLMVQDVITVLERHFEADALSGVIQEVDKLFIHKFESLIDSLERMPNSSPGKLITSAPGLKPAGKSKKNSRRLH